MFTTKFGEKLAEGLAGQWAAQKIGPALVFWAGGLLAWRGDWPSVEKWLTDINHTATYVALALGGLLIVTVSSAVVQWLQTPVIRSAEGYWPWPFRRLRFFLAGRLIHKISKKADRWEELDNIDEKQISIAQHAERVALDVWLNRYPLDPKLLMPTTLGNLLRAAEEYPQARYGLSAIECWPRLWLVMPKETQEAIAQAREQLDAAAGLMLWSLLFLAWLFLSRWAALSLILLPVAYLRMIGAAEHYGLLIRAAFDLHRFKLYQALAWPLPPDPAHEEDRGKQLTDYLFRGTAPADISFIHKPASPEARS